MSNKNLQLKQLGEWVKKHREKMNFSQETAAEKVGLSRYQWIRIENGQSGTKRDTILSIAKQLGADATEGLTLLAGLEPDSNSIKKPTNPAEFFDALDKLGLDIQFDGGRKVLEGMDEDDLQELLDSVVANAVAKSKRKKFGLTK